MSATRSLALAGAALALSLGGARSAPGGEPAADGKTVEERLVDLRGPSIVTVRAVVTMKFAMGGQAFEQESKEDRAGVVVDPTGLVLLSDGAQVLKALTRQLQGAQISLTPKSLKVVLPGADQELEAVLVAKDAALGLVFLQVMGVEGKPLAALDLSLGVDPSIGQALWGLDRLGRGYDHALEVLRLYPSRRVEQPRPMWGISGQFSGEGLPAFDAEGRPVGIVTTQFGAESEGDASRLEMGTFLLPLPAVRRLLEQAKKKVPDAVARAKEAAAAPPKDEPGMESPGMESPGMDAPGMDAPPTPPAPKDPPKEPPSGR